MQENNDELVLKRAQEIVKERGIPLIEAMMVAESELIAPSEIPASFTVEIFVKPRVARWILAQFQATADHPLEKRLGAYLTVVLARTRATAMRDMRDIPEIGEGRAVTLTRANFQSQVPK